jgi:hypothetical protein
MCYSFHSVSILFKCVNAVTYSENEILLLTIIEMLK